MHLIDEKQKEFASFLRISRLKSNFSSKQASKKIGVNSKSILSWENGISFPTSEKIKNIADTYDINQEDLKKRYEEAKKEKEELKNGRKSTPVKKIRQNYADKLSGGVEKVKRIRSLNKEWIPWD